MDFLQNFLVFLHILGAAIIVGIWFARIKNPTVMPGQFHGALLQLVTGLLLVGLAEMDDYDVNHVKIAVKLVLALAIAAMAFVGQRKYKKGEPVGKGLANGVGILTVVNIAVATMW
ncbi:hypothetical protein QNO08_06530 [Arthrobacter sp. zg-Y820]|uniref:hypothetical protein n=1 Tax=unclassified Arthrobacter TaxID=235627 RepID=UPI001E5DF57F|nr:MULTISPECIES: hypothetical protein [unclassified Arthrobacter]MCC9197823.1 hypothetical protein [Arthrobacter sp. zg-Y820]MDK1280690.1 hypothetical protein [Arthrobacter sp. zg.Y820]MDK1360967.1 hypothetical protein [Arthrobacter sp. zg-Y1219]WIB10677.1 hypothetical protein QNO08_06530 [Arthrobacter sp. zg-Y820]